MLQPVETAVGGGGEVDVLGAAAREGPDRGRGQCEARRNRRGSGARRTPSHRPRRVVERCHGSTSWCVRWYTETAASSGDRARRPVAVVQIALGLMCRPARGRRERHDGGEPRAKSSGWRCALVGGVRMGHDHRGRWRRRPSRASPPSCSSRASCRCRSPRPRSVRRCAATASSRFATPLGSGSSTPVPGRRTSCSPSRAPAPRRAPVVPRSSWAGPSGRRRDRLARRAQACTSASPSRPLRLQLPPVRQGNPTGRCTRAELAQLGLPPPVVPGG